MATKEEKQKRQINEVDFNNSSARALQNEKRNSAYDISIIKYPSDLGGADLLHYVQFAINIRGKSKFAKSNGGNLVTLGEVERAQGGAGLSPDALASKSLRGVTAVAAGVGAGLAVTALAEQAAKAINATGALSKKIVNLSGAATGGIVGGAVALAPVLDSDKSQRISDVIALHVDGPPTVRYGMQYANKDLGTMAGLISGGVFESQDALKAGSETAAAFGATMAKLPGAFGATDLGAALSASSKTTLNAFKEVIFEAVDFRTFAFKYKFLPKNKKESDSIKQIIDLFKFHMHPEMSGSKLFYIYPSEFQITYFFKGQQNKYFHSFRPCVLESMEVNYGGEQFSSFRDGQPSEVNMSLVFKETEILTKELIGAGRY